MSRMNSVTVSNVVKPIIPALPVQSYTLNGKCDVELMMFDYGLAVYSVVPNLLKDQMKINGESGDDGEYSCWDASATFQEDGSIRMEGSDGPCGGTRTVQRVLVITFEHVGKITIEKFEEETF